MKKKNDQQIPPVLSPRISAMLGKLPSRLLTANLIAIAVILAAIVAVAVLMPNPSPPTSSPTEHGAARTHTDFLIFLIPHFCCNFAALYVSAYTYPPH